MRALTRMRSLAAACALLLVVAGSAAAWVPGRPIDRGGSPPPTPTEVGEPDTGNNLVYIYQLFLAAQISNPYIRVFALPKLTIRLSRPMRSRAGR
jgi:hypothetical protein